MRASELASTDGYSRLMRASDGESGLLSVCSELDATTCAAIDLREERGEPDATLVDSKGCGKMNGFKIKYRYTYKHTVTGTET